MKHPILDGPGYKVYVIVWIALILTHASLLHFYFDMGLVVSITDSFIHNVIFALMIPGFWYLVVFAGLEKDKVSVMSMHLGAAFLSVLLWFYASQLLLRLLFGTHTPYLDLLLNANLMWLILGSTYYCLSVLIFYLIKYYQDAQQKSKRELELQSLLKDAELRMLKSQINPHFIFNSLNSISALTVSWPEKAQEMVIKLSEFLRYSLGKGNKELNPLKEELENISLYLDIEKIRFGHRLLFEKRVDEVCLEVPIPNLILQPLVENAVKYGLYDTLEAVTIRLSCDIENDLLTIKISNGFDPEAAPAKGEGIGLHNVKKRLSLIYGGNGLLETKQQSGIFEASLKIPTLP